MIDKAEVLGWLDRMIEAMPGTYNAALAEATKDLIENRPLEPMKAGPTKKRFV